MTRGGSCRYFNDELRAILCAQPATADALLLGRRTYEELTAFWPGLAGSGNLMADRITVTPKLVVSTTLTRADWKGRRHGIAQRCDHDGQHPQLGDRTLDPPG